MSLQAFGNVTIHVRADGRVDQLTPSGWETIESVEWSLTATAPNGEVWRLHHDPEEQVWAWSQVAPSTPETP